MAEPEPPENGEPPPPGGVTVRVAIGLTAIALVSAVLSVQVALWLRSGTPADPVNLLLVFCLGPLVALYVGLQRCAPESSTSEALGLTRPRLAALLAALVAGIALAIAVRCGKVLLAARLPAALLAPPGAAGDVDLDTPSLARQVVMLAAEVLMLLELIVLEQGLLLRNLRPRNTLVRGVVVTLLSLACFLILPRDEPIATWVFEGLVLSATLTYTAIAGLSTWIPLALEVAYLASYLLVELKVLQIPGITGDLAAGSVRPLVLLSSLVLLAAALFALRHSQWREPD